MWVYSPLADREKSSEGLQVQFPQASIVSVDTDIATQSRTAQICDRFVRVKKRLTHLINS
jgi:hypothetical protein